MHQKIFLLIIVSLSVLFSKLSYAASPCAPVYFGQDSNVCECSSTYCDTVAPLGDLAKDEVAIYTTSESGLRLSRETTHFQNEITQSAETIELNPRKQYQTILGFGGAFTDAATQNILSLSNAAQENLLRSYFSPAGIQYSLGRVPMGSIDFSTRIYSYDDVPNDFELHYFHLVEEDLHYKIPVIVRAMKMSDREISLFATPWSAPAWMKTNNSMMGGTLQGVAGDAYHETYAKYFTKFFDAYAQFGIHFWGTSVVNEPTDNVGIIQSMIFTPTDERDLIKRDLGPELKAHDPEIHLMILDDDVGFLNEKANLPNWADTIMSDPLVAQYVSGTGIHWYFEPTDHLQRLDATHVHFPDKFILATEACPGAFIVPFTGPRLGYFEDGMMYAHDIINDLQHAVIGWTDLNLALDAEGGPNWTHNFTDAPIIVNAKQDVFYKQPTFYVLGHFSKFIPKGSMRIDAALSGPSTLEAVAFKTPEHHIVVVVLNHDKNNATPFYIHDPERGYIQASIPSMAIQTYIFNS